MKKVLRDFGVDVAGVHYAHGASIDPGAAVPPVPDEVPEEHRANYADGLQRKTAEDLAAAEEAGFIVDETALDENGHIKPASDTRATTRSKRTDKEEAQ